MRGEAQSSRLKVQSSKKTPITKLENTAGTDRSPRRGAWEICFLELVLNFEL
jgi:hypothetical protein